MLYSVAKQLRRRHGRPPLGSALTRLGLPAFLAVLGPGLLAGLSDDDPAGITTYSIAGARYGYTAALGPGCSPSRRWWSSTSSAPGSGSSPARGWSPRP